MNKQEIIDIGKNKYKQDSKTINQVLEFVLNLRKEKIFLLDEINPIYIGQIEYIFEKLLTGFPLAYITKKSNFKGLDFYVNENVLIPRDDTEVLVREVIVYIKNVISSEVERSVEERNNNYQKNIVNTKEQIPPFQSEGQKERSNTQFSVINSKFLLLDIGTGSGIIPICLAKSIDFDGIYAIDISENAVEVAKENVFRHNLEDKIVLLNCDFKKFEFELFRGKNLIITANLPYIKEGDFNNMDFPVYSFEPKTALYGGVNTGFELYQDLIEILVKNKNLFNSLIIFIEIGFDQYEISKKYLEEKGLKFEFFKDTNNIDRVIKIIL